MALSVTQLGEWIFDQRCEGVLSHEPTIVRLEGTLHTAALRAAFAGLQRRHECLRTRFPLIDGVPMQVVEEPRADALPLVDLSALPAGLREREAARIAEETLSAPVRLDDRPPVRQALIRMGRKEHLLLVGIPHITADLWSATLLNDDLMALYGACHDGVPGRPPTAAAQYADYARWQRARWDERRTAGELARWRARLDGLAAADLPLDRPRPAGRRRDCFFVGDELDGELSEELRAFARAENVTLYVVLLAAFHALLGQAAGAGRVLTTSLTAARHGRAVQEMTGPFSDYLAVVGDLTGDPDFRELLRRTRDACLIAHDFQRLPFPMVIEGLDPAKELHPHPLEQIEFHLHNTPPPVLDFAGGLRVSGPLPEPEPGEAEPVPWTADFAFELYDYGTGHLPLHVLLDGHLFDPESAGAWADRYRSVLRAALADPTARLSQLVTPHGPGAEAYDVRRAEEELERCDGVLAALVVMRERRIPTGLAVREPVGYLALAPGRDGTRPHAHGIRGQTRGRAPTVLIERPLAEIRRAAAARSAGGDPAGALPPPEECAWLPEGAPPPADEVERRLAAHWHDVLGAPPAHVTERFYRPGAADLDAIRFLTRVAADFEITVPLVDFMAAPTVSGVKEYLLRNLPVM
ncbi:condensation domain-containing protein [Streptomyces sp. NPDC046215]